MPRKTPKLIEDELQDLLDEAQAIQAIADQETGGEFTADQQERWTELMEGDECLVNAKRSELEAAVKLENEKRALADHRASLRDLSAHRVPGNQPPAQPRVVNRLGALRAFKAETAQQAAQDAYDCGMWLRAALCRMRNDHDERAEMRCNARGFQIKGALTEGTSTAGGYTVPDPLASAIINYRALSGISRQICRVVPMTADTLQIPKKTGVHTVYYPGEATAITSSDQTFGQVPLTVKKRAVLTQISQELSDDAVINIMDDTAAEIGSDLAIQEDAELINGDGTATYGNELGLLNQLNTTTGRYFAGGSSSSGSNTWPEIALSDFTSTMSLLPSKHLAYGAQWVCSAPFYYGVMVKLMTAAGGTIPGQIEAGAPANSLVGASGRMFLGYPVYLTDQMPTTTAVTQISALFGSFNRAVIIGDRMAVNVATSADYAFNQDVLTLRGTSRYDIAVHEPGTASAAGAYVGLATSTT